MAVPLSLALPPDHPPALQVPGEATTSASQEGPALAPRHPEREAQHLRSGTSGGCPGGSASLEPATHSCPRCACLLSLSKVSSLGTPEASREDTEFSEVFSPWLIPLCQPQALPGAGVE